MFLNRLISVAVGLLLGAHLSAAQLGQTASVEGRVLDAKTGAALANAQVQIDQQAYPTDASGKFAASTLSPGRHQFSITADGHQSKQTVITLPDGRSKNLEDVIAPGFDNYKMGAFDADLNLAYSPRKDMRVTAGISNPFNMYGREYSGTRSRMNQFDRQGVDFVLGVQWKWPLGMSHQAAP